YNNHRSEYEADEAEDHEQTRSDGPPPLIGTLRIRTVGKVVGHPKEFDTNLGGPRMEPPGQISHNHLCDHRLMAASAPSGAIGGKPDPGQAGIHMEMTKR